MKGVAAGSFSFYDFYMRRVRRIFPALMLVLASTFIAGWFLMMGDEFKALSKHIISGIGFVQNVILYTESGYFDASAETKPLMHLWSLGVEEQFYLVFPVILILLHRFKISLLPALIVMALASFTLSIVKISESPAGAFFLPQYRFWELLFGSFLAYAYVNGGMRTRARNQGSLQNWASVLGLSLIVVAVVVVDKSRQFPGYWALLPVLGSTLIIFAGPEAWINRNILASKTMVFIGLISYPLYLWHWPLFSFAYIYFSGTPTVFVRLVMLFAAFVLAFFTYKVVELPLRQKVSGKRAFAGLIVLALAFVAVSAGVFQKNGLPDRQDEKQEFAAYFANGRPDWHYFIENKIPERYRYDCDWYNQEAFFGGNATNVPVPSISEKCYKSSATQKVLFWGDSHAQQYIYGVTHELPSEVGVLVAATSACLPNLPELDASPAEYCRKSNQFAIEAIKDQKPDVVVIGQIIAHDVSSSLPQLAAALASYGVKHVIVMGPVPRWETRLNQIILRKYWNATPTYIKDDVIKDVLDSDLALKAKYGKGEGGFQYVSIVDLMCGEQGCRTYIGADRKIGITTFDNSHLTPATSVYVAQTTLVPLILQDLETKK
jgi:peptidoglycan/LPS O-acetylase OafA/YrhL